MFYDLNKSGGVTVYADVGTNETMWLIYQNNDMGIAEIHVHSSADINGAGWQVQRGKQTYHGMTVDIQ